MKRYWYESILFVDDDTDFVFGIEHTLSNWNQCGTSIIF